MSPVSARLRVWVERLLGRFRANFLDFYEPRKLEANSAFALAMYGLIIIAGTKPGAEAQTAMLRAGLGGVVSTVGAGYGLSLIIRWWRRRPPADGEEPRDPPAAG